ncbi:chemotaxis protein methyltransferase CheR [Desulfonatronum thiosulfatophilum]|uniref:Chemotaxis protein methyltransferase CheR n=1 Tax=Desulfonatronum thiosulfatophilum TaxID=617002 RepID=A0A1G6A050_9BACT|nr:protein-glutamate O-methyltransferase CheR [Desulfonatronum thiosulfatophilum]SDB01838.1 chemotaxis protein methyltransferase CheR [Desulfonatronum thiosulfatophilum]
MKMPAASSQDRKSPGTSFAEISPDFLSRLGTLIGKKMGLRIEDNKLDDLRRAVLDLWTTQGSESPEAFMRTLLDSSLSDQYIPLLAERLTTGETYFFREQNSLDALRLHILPRLMAAQPSRRSLRIWCAGCSSGEEAYTVAMLLDHNLPEPPTWNIRILATDINPRALEKARRGVYSKWSFRGVSDAIRDRYFLPLGNNTYAVKPRYRANVTFAPLNLATDEYPALLNNTHSLDLIICRNVMIYLLPETIRRVLTGFYRCLVEGGWLIVSASESARLRSSKFRPIHLPGATVYRKSMLDTATYRIEFPDDPDPSDLSNTILAESREDAKNTPAGLARGDEKCSFRDRITAGHETAAQLPPPPLASPVPPTPEHLWPQYKQAVQALRRGRPDEARTLLAPLLTEQEMMPIAPDRRSKAMQLMATIQADKGLLGEALDWCRRALIEDKTNAGVLHLQAMILQESGQDQEARQALKHLLYLEPECIAAHAGLGSIASRDGQLKEAGRHFENALELLSALPAETPVPEMDGMTAGRLMETIGTMIAREGLR